MLTGTSRSLAKYILYLISAHTVLLYVYGYAHEKIDMYYQLGAFTPLLLLFCLAPLLAAFLLTTQSVRQGAILLLGILPAELIYHIVARFSGMPPLARQDPSFVWKILYEGSFGLLLALEVIGFWMTLKVLKDVHAHLSSLKSSNENQGSIKE
jgi:hypothetical protein